jgi:hypothetical protein
MRLRDGDPTFVGGDSINVRLEVVRGLKKKAIRYPDDVS